MKTLLIIPLAFVLLVPPSAFAAEGYWIDEWGKQLTHSPTVCLFQPDDPRIDENKWKMWYTDAKTGIETWRSILDQTGKGNWGITIVEVPLDKAPYLNHSACDISVHFVKQLYETDGDCAGALGCAWKGGLIKIVYSSFDYCGKQYYPEYGITFHIYCFTDNFTRSKQMANTVQHEFGHALGLGHYRGYDTITTQSWYESKIGAPSIMAWIEPNEEVRQITKNDVDRLLEWYGSQGFGKKKNTNTLFVYPEIVKTEPQISGTQNIEVASYGTSLVKITGSVPNSLYSRGMPAEIQVTKPDGMKETFAVMVTKHKNFEYPMSFSKNSILGTYEILISYNGEYIQKNEINVSRTLSSTSEKITTESIQKPKQIITIPEWIKNNVKWWSEGAIDDKSFTSGIQFLISDGIIDVPIKQKTVDASDEIPEWVRLNADWWVKGFISDSDFVRGIEYLANSGIIQVN